VIITSRLRCERAACTASQVRCPNMDNACKYKEEYMLCAQGPFRGKCMAASAACDDVSECFSVENIYYCREYDSISNTCFSRVVVPFQLPLFISFV